MKNPGALPKNYQNSYTQIIYLELELFFDLFNGGIDLPPFLLLGRYVIGEYGTGDLCELHVVENVDDACRLLLNGELCSLGACCTAILRIKIGKLKPVVLGFQSIKFI